jgi:hypothetical protein
MGTKSAWTEERRQRQAMIARKTKPWEHSTGPRTEAGKRRSSRNATSIWAARRRALEAVTENILAQVRLYAEVLGIKECELFANRHREIDFRMATEDQQDRYVDLKWDEIELKAECLALWPSDLNCEDYLALDNLDWLDWCCELRYDPQSGRGFGPVNDPVNDNEGRNEGEGRQSSGGDAVKSEVPIPPEGNQADKTDGFVQRVARP